MENVTEYLDKAEVIIAAIGAVALLIGRLIIVYRDAINDNKTVSDALLLTLHALKDEAKMDEDGTVFKPAIKDKIEEIGASIESDVKAIQKAKDIIDNSNNRKGFKIGSHKGKPIYAEDIGNLIGAFGAVKSIFSKRKR